MIFLSKLRFTSSSPTTSLNRVSGRFSFTEHARPSSESLPPHFAGSLFLGEHRVDAREHIGRNADVPTCRGCARPARKSTAWRTTRNLRRRVCGPRRRPRAPCGTSSCRSCGTIRAAYGPCHTSSPIYRRPLSVRLRPRLLIDISPCLSSKGSTVPSSSDASFSPSAAAREEADAKPRARSCFR